MNETVYTQWEVSPSQNHFIATIVFVVITFLFLFSAFTTFVIQKSTDLIMLAIPIVLFFIWIAALPDLLKSWGAVQGNYQVYVTDKGIYKKISDQNYNFIAWSQMTGYDMGYSKAATPFGKLFSWPTYFTIKSKFSDDNFAVAAFGENVDVTGAYLKENNVPFGFVQN